LAFVIVIQVSEVVASQSKLLLTPAQPDNSRTQPASKSEHFFIAVFLKIYALKGLAGCESAE